MLTSRISLLPWKQNVIRYSYFNAILHSEIRYSYFNAILHSERTPLPVLGEGTTKPSR